MHLCKVIQRQTRIIQVTAQTMDMSVYKGASQFIKADRPLQVIYSSLKVVLYAFIPRPNFETKHLALMSNTEKDYVLVLSPSPSTVDSPSSNSSLAEKINPPVRSSTLLGLSLSVSEVELICLLEAYVAKIVQSARQT